MGLVVDGELVTMSTKERYRVRVVEAVAEKRPKQAQAARRLGLSVRQIKRLVRALRDQGTRRRLVVGSVLTQINGPDLASDRFPYAPAVAGAHVFRARMIRMRDAL